MSAEDIVRSVQQLVEDEERYVAELDQTEISILIPNAAGEEFIERLLDALSVVVETVADAVPERNWDPFVASVRNPKTVPMTLLKRALEGRV